AAVDEMNTLSTPFSKDIPNAFRYVDKWNRTFFSGPHIKAIQNFARVFNYDLHLDMVENLPRRRVVQLYIAQGKYNLSMHGVFVRPAQDDIFTNYTETTYPFETLKNCVMVPLPPELPKWQYMVWPLGRYVWLTLVVAIFYVAFLLRYVHWRETVTRSYSRNLLHALGILLYSPNMNMVCLYQTSVAVMVFYTLLCVLGFILTNYHISHMTTFDMKPVFVKRVHTWDDLIESNLRIIIPDVLLDDLRFAPSVDVRPLEPQFESREWHVYQELLVKPSREFAYVITEDVWDFTNRQQQVLIQPYFGMSQVCFGSVLNAFPIQKNASFAGQLHRFMSYAQESGLWSYWEEFAFIYAVRAGYAHIYLDTYPVEPLNMEFFTTAWIVMAVGIPVCCLGFALELLWYKGK
ncbi:hypothetical protein KR222_004510, partial [Zaprionus bogoriensis]